ncbi:MAG: hypothetical protein LBR27_01620 [Bifidobacteriaceae bacterium]|nr:hypothetical protein [Bifidobacteriaceae bacterium]
MIPASEHALLRDLAKRVADLAADPVNDARIARIRANNGLVPGRPTVWIDELPWHELNINDELTLRCESAAGRAMEEFFRRTLFRWAHFQVDMVVEPAYSILKAFDDSGIGIEIEQETLSTDAANRIVSHHYEDQLDTEEAVDALLTPVIVARPDLDEQHIAEAEEVLHGIMPVRLRGHQIDYQAWDEIAQFRGVENCLIDMLDRPELIHRTIARFTEIGLARYTQMEAQGLLEADLAALHSTPAYCDELPAADYAGGPYRMKDVWFRGRSQLFSAASPGMREEFCLQYMRPLMERFALSYYGCCDPLEDAMPFLKQAPNLRKVGCTPWADARSLAEQVGGDYVLACKPNPAAVAVELDVPALERELSQIIELCLQHGCPYEFVLKDISTVGHNPNNLFRWAQVATEVVDRYY